MDHHPRETLHLKIQKNLNISLTFNIQHFSCKGNLSCRRVRS